MSHSSKDARKLIGELTANAIASSTRALVFKLDPRSFKQAASDPDRFAGFHIVARGETQGPAFVAKLSSLLLDDRSWAWGLEKHTCREDRAIGLRLEGSGETVELFIAQPCDRVSFLRRARRDPTVVPGEYFDPIDAQMSALLAPLFSTK